MSTYATTTDHSGHVHANGTDLFAIRRGSGPDVLLISGLGDPWEAWLAQVDALSATRRVTAFDNRGAGRSPLPDEPFTIATMADDAAGVLDALDVDRAHVVGFSMGGCIAQELALRHPERVSSLVLSGTWARSDAYHQAMIRGWRWHAEHAPDERTFLETWLVWVYTRAAYERGWVAEVVDAMLSDPHPPTLDALQRAMDACLRHDTLDRLHEIAAPALLVAGDADPQCPPPIAYAMAERLPDARVHVWKGQSHQPFQEEPVAYNALLEEFWLSLPA